MYSIKVGDFIFLDWTETERPNAIVVFSFLIGNK